MIFSYSFIFIFKVLIHQEFILMTGVRRGLNSMSSESRIGRGFITERDFNNHLIFKMDHSGQNLVWVGLEWKLLDWRVRRSV